MMFIACMGWAGEANSKRGGGNVSQICATYLHPFNDLCVSVRLTKVKENIRGSVLDGK